MKYVWQSSMARSLTVVNLLRQNAGSIINCLQQSTEVAAKWGTPCCSRPQPATDNGVKDGRSNLLAATPYPTQGSTPCTNRKTCCNNQDANTLPLVCQATDCLCSHSGWRWT